MGDIMRYKTNSGEYCTIVAVKSGGRAVIEFEGYQGQYLEVYKDNLRRGKVKNPFKPSVCGVGIIGKGLYDTNTLINGVNVYRIWVRMIQRCYLDKMQILNKTYVGCKVSDDFLMYQNFANWCVEQEYLQEGHHLDKDLLVKGNKIYSAETCCFLPRRLNDILSYRKIEKSEIMIGVSCHSEGSYISKIGMDNSQKYLGTFKTPEDAFYAYKEAKEAHIKNLANHYKDQIDPRAYTALMNYEVNTDD